VGLLRNNVQCNSCCRDMTWFTEANIPDVFRWWYRRKFAGAKCSDSRTIKHGSWFQQRNVTFQEILYSTYDIVRRDPAQQIQNEYRFSWRTFADWGIFGWCSWSAALKWSVILTRPSRLTTASSVGESTLGDTLLRVSGRSAVLKEGPVEHFLFPYRTGPPTHWRPSYMSGLNSALRSSVIAGVRTAISTLRVPHIELWTTASNLAIPTPGTTQIRPKSRGVASRSSSASTTVGRLPLQLPPRTLHVCG